MNAGGRSVSVGWGGRGERGSGVLLGGLGPPMGGGPPGGSGVDMLSQVRGKDEREEWINS